MCKGCEGVFGFKLYPTGPRIEAALREEVLQRQQLRQKQRAEQAQRTAKAAASAPALSEEQRRKQDDHLFLIGLRDTCPRCGGKADSADKAEAKTCKEKKKKKARTAPPASGGAGGPACVIVDADVDEDDAEEARDHKAADKAESHARRKHLRECTDEVAHRRHYKEQLRADAPKAVRAAKAAEDDEVMNAAAWARLGGTAESAWLLTDTQLAKQCERHGIEAETAGGREAQLAKLAEKLNDGHGPARLTEASAPANLHAMPLAQLRGVCAAHGLTPPADAGVDELIAMLEGRSEAIARLEGGGLEVEPMRLCQKQGEGAEDGAEGLEDADDAAYVEGEEEEEDDDDDE